MLNPEQLVGTFRRFGPTGPVYQIVGIGAELSEGERLMRVQVVESGEELDYKFFDILHDPAER